MKLAFCKHEWLKHRSFIIKKLDYQNNQTRFEEILKKNNMETITNKLISQRIVTKNLKWKTKF